MTDLLEASIADVADRVDESARQRRAKSIQMLLQPPKRSRKHDFVELEDPPSCCLDFDLAAAID